MAELLKVEYVRTASILHMYGRA